MNIDATKSRDFEGRLREDATIGCGNGQIRLERTERIASLGPAPIFGLVDRNLMLVGQLLDRWRQQLQPTPLAGIGSGKHAGDLIGATQQFLENTGGDFGSSEEYDPQRCSG